MRAGLLSGLVLLAALAGCDRQSAQERAASDARDVAMVEAAQQRKPPSVRLAPQPITFADLQEGNLFGAGCAFTPDSGAGGDPVLYTDDTRAVMKLDGAMVILASDNGSAELPYATREHYVGKTHDLRLTKAPGEGEPGSEESMKWTGAVTVRDQWQREVYAARGSLECGA